MMRINDAVQFLAHVFLIEKQLKIFTGTWEALKYECSYFIFQKFTYEPMNKTAIYIETIKYWNT